LVDKAHPVDKQFEINALVYSKRTDSGAQLWLRLTDSNQGVEFPPGAKQALSSIWARKKATQLLLLSKPNVLSLLPSQLSLERGRGETFPAIHISKQLIGLVHARKAFSVSMRAFISTITGHT